MSAYDPKRTLSNCKRLIKIVIPNVVKCWAGNMATESADLISAWHDLYVTLGTASATLIGLLFVAASLHLGDVVSNPGFRVRAYHINLYLLTLLVEAVVILVPQPISFLGGELFALNLVGLLLPLSTFYTFVYKRPDISHRGGVKTSGVVALSLAYLLGMAGGITLIKESHSGMYLVTVSYTALLVAVVLRTWSIMLGVEQTDKTASR
jgi:hypothetical protein